VLTVATQLKARNKELADKLEAAEDRLLLLGSRVDHEIEQYKANHASTAKMEAEVSRSEPSVFRAAFIGSCLQQNFEQQLQQLKLENKHLTDEVASSFAAQYLSKRSWPNVWAVHTAAAIIAAPIVGLKSPTRSRF